MPYFQLENNLDLNHTLLLSQPWYKDTGFPSIGALLYSDDWVSCAYDFYFFGHFNGRDRTISNLYINRQNIDPTDTVEMYCYPDILQISTDNQYHSLFGSLTLGSIYNLKLDNVYVDTNLGHGAGGLTVKTMYGTNIDNVKITGTIKADSLPSALGEAGGLVGINQGLITKSSFDGNIYGTNKVGGLIGENKGDVNLSYFKGNVTGNSYVGGLIGNATKTVLNQGTTARNSYSLANITGTTNYIGGLIGNNVPGMGPSIGGITNNCYFSGNVNLSSGYRGCFAGMYYPSSSYISNVFYNSTLCTLPDNGYGTGKTTTQMKIQSTFTGWDFTTIWAINSTTNGGYPYLRNNLPN